ncbi:uncharacterized protein AMSG_03488 [Thecamonas trahens ATCC 50062]|uniref:Uncharacterized protein n=1 Tax=Thecamonas trahens ATCC 50062 TaxID=461836 RepID=A0A0L0D434_THETB|nr:hypothetical protein AMSG_03488 [Thecamonas trahens ATCC 50062]KNC47064.1 hypothetical protein AMSG_03488 [Thecamonas trahens ATCC 50062]|eukprot:XP_013759844.1 hypothetical protein AMSG_03488 [Thecamonas trahens ATCC 50062]
MESPDNGTADATRRLAAAEQRIDELTALVKRLEAQNSVTTTARSVPTRRASSSSASGEGLGTCSDSCSSALTASSLDGDDETAHSAAKSLLGSTASVADEEAAAPPPCASDSARHRRGGVSNVSYVAFVAVVAAVIEVIALVVAHASYLGNVLMVAMVYWWLVPGLAASFYFFRYMQNRPDEFADRITYLVVVGVLSLALATAVCVSGFVWPVVWDVSINNRVAYDISVDNVDAYGNAKAFTFTDAVLLTEFTRSTGGEQPILVAPLVSRAAVDAANGTRPIGPVNVWVVASKFSDLAVDYSGGYVASGLTRSRIEDAARVAVGTSQGALIGPTTRPLILKWRNPKAYVTKFTTIFVATNVVCWLLYLLLAIPLSMAINMVHPIVTT